MLFEYVDINTPFHKLDVRTKIIYLFCISVLSLIFFNPIHLSVTLLISVLVAMSAKVPIARVLGKILLPTLIIPLSMLFFAAFTVSVPDQPNLQIAKVVLYDLGRVPLLGHLQLTVAGIITGINFGLKMFVMIFAAVTILFATDLEDIFYVFNQLKIPYAISFIITTTLRLFPTISEEMETTKQAQISRGSNLQKAKGLKQRLVGGTALLVPALVGAWRRSENLALAMVSRGFSSSTKRTFLRCSQMNFLDYSLSAFMILIVGIAIFLKITTGFGAM